MPHSDGDVLAQQRLGELARVCKKRTPIGSRRGPSTQALRSAEQDIAVEGRPFEVRGEMASEHDAVNQQIGQDDPVPSTSWMFRPSPAGIENRKDVVLDEAPRITGLARLARSDFSSGVKRTDPPVNSIHAPQIAAGMCTTASRGQRSTRRAAGRNEQHEAEVKEDEGIGQKPAGTASADGRLPPWLRTPPAAPSRSPPPPSRSPPAAPRRSRGTSGGGCPGRG